MRESKVERYLHEQVTKHGGTTRKFSSPGRRNVPDRIVIWPHKFYTAVHFVELKAPGAKPRRGQVREIERLRALKCEVFVFDNLPQVDAYVKAYSQ